MKKIIQSFLLVFVSLPGFAQWSTDLAYPNLIRQGTNSIEDFYLHSDGNDGTFIVWKDWRTFGPNIYSQRIDASAALQWGENEGLICRAMIGGEMIGSIYEIGSTSDGNGNSIIAWSDNKSAYNEVYVQKITGTGQIQWLDGGISIGNNFNTADRVKVISDGNGGAIVAWLADQNPDLTYEVYIQRINGSGIFQWQSNGIKVTDSEEYNNIFLDLVSDGNGGAILTWEEDQDGWFSDGPNPMFAQRFDQDGNALWGPGGVLLGNRSSGLGKETQSIADGNGGLITVWYDVRNSSGNLYTQKINADGQPQWTPGGLPVCTADGDQIKASIVSDMKGGAVIAWQDPRNGSTNNDIYAQKVNSAGQPQWAPNGLAICSNSSEQLGTMMADDGAGGAVIIWADRRAIGNSPLHNEVYAQRVDGTGALLWTVDGVLVGSREYTSFPAGVINNGDGGHVVVWTSDYNIFATRLSENGKLPVKLVSFKVDKENDDAILTWKTSEETNNMGFDIERSADGKHFEKIGFVNPMNSGSGTLQNYQYLDTTPLEGSNYYRLKQLDLDGKFAYSKMVNVDFKALTRLFIYPNPAADAVNVEAREATGQIQVTDMLGRVAIETRITKPSTYINIKTLSPGMYILKAGSVSSVLVKQ